MSHGGGGRPGRGGKWGGSGGAVRRCGHPRRQQRKVACRAFLPVHRQSDGHSRCSCCTGTRWSSYTGNRGNLGVHVLVNFNEKFLQSNSSIWSCLRFSSSSEGGTFLLCNRNHTHSTTCAKNWRFLGTGAVLGGFRHARRCATIGAGERSVQAALESHSCSALAVGTAAGAGGRKRCSFAFS